CRSVSKLYLVTISVAVEALGPPIHVRNSKSRIIHHMTPPLPLIRRRRISQRGDQLTHGSPLRYQTFLFFIVSWPVATFLMDCHANFNCLHDSAFVGCVGESRGPG